MVVVNGNEGGGPVHNISGPAQGVWQLGQIQTHRYPGGLWSGALDLPHTTRLLGKISYGGLHGKILRISVSRFLVGDSVGPVVP